MSVYLLSDIELRLRGRTYREPEGPHVAVVRGKDIDAALDHLDARPDCRALAVVGAPPDVPDLELLAGRRLFVSDPEGAAMRAMVDAGLAAGADVEWYRGDPPEEVLGAWALPVGAVVLAAGSGSRMGRDNKLLLEVGGRPMVRHVIGAASSGGCHVIHAVYASEDVRTAIGQAAVTVYNPRAASGQASSLQVGLQSLPEEVAAAIILLGDQPLVGARTVRMLLRAWRAEGARPATAAAYDQEAGWRPPVVLDRSLWPDLFDLHGDEGARALFKNRPDLVEAVPAMGRADDVDTPEDYARIVKLFPRPLEDGPAYREP